MRAAAALANQDAAGSGEMCIRCHAPIGWLGGRSAGGELADLLPGDLAGVTCTFCHGMLDPIARVDAPAEDADVLAALGLRPGGACRTGGTPCDGDGDCGASGPCDVDPGGGRFVVDPGDSRRGPFLLGFASHATIASPYHRRAEVCAPCHDVSTPTYSRLPDGSYALNDLGAPHPTQRPQDMFPEQRTFSEWRASDFARGGVVFPDGRFGGHLTATLPNTVPVSTCQDCHMPDARVRGCNIAEIRPDMPTHGFAGANTWVLGAVLAEYGGASGLAATTVAEAQARAAQMLAAASDVEVVQSGSTLRVRVINQTGHKLPTGYPEGRRMWLNVRFFVGDAAQPVAEDGRYDAATATLEVARTAKIYETRHAIDAAVAGAAGLATGTPFHLVLSNRIEFDDRIPPRGFTNAAFASFAAAPAGYVYADGQHWDDTTYAVPPRATRVEVSLYYQTTSREYAEFLRDAVPTGAGVNAYARWEAAGRSAPVVMDQVTLALTPACGSDAPFCCGELAGLACDDADPCTAGDACGDGRCAGRVAGATGVRCELGRLVARDVCATPPPRGLRASVAKRVRKARALLATAERKPAKAAVLLGRAARTLSPVTARVEAAVTAGARARRVSPACAATLTAAVERVLDGLAALAP
jgi:hypothetical protein